MFTFILEFLFGKDRESKVIAKNTFWLSLSEVFSGLLKILLIIFSARVLGALEYGKFALAMSFAGMLVIIADFGVNQVLVRELSKFKDFGILKYALGLKLILALFYLSFIIFLIYGLGLFEDIREISLVLGVTFFLYAFLEFIFSVLRALQQMEKEALIKSFDALLTTLLGFLVLNYYPKSLYLALAYLSSAFLTTLIGVWWFKKKLFKLKLAFDYYFLKKFLALALPLALFEVSNIVYGQTDSVIMGMLGERIQIGWYSAGFKIVVATTLIALLFNKAFFPALSQSFSREKNKFQDLVNRLLLLVLSFSIPVGIGGYLLAEDIILFFYSHSFLPAVLSFKLLVLAIPFFFLNFTFSRILTSADCQKTAFFIVLGGAILNLILNLLLIPTYSLYGASFATFISLALTFLGLWLYLRSKIKLRFSLEFKLGLAFVVFSTIFMSLLLILLESLNLIFKIAIGAIFYFMILGLIFKLKFKI